MEVSTEPKALTTKARIVIALAAVVALSLVLAAVTTWHELRKRREHEVRQAIAAKKLALTLDELQATAELIHPCRPRRPSDAEVSDLPTSAVVFSTDEPTTTEQGEVMVSGYLVLDGWNRPLLYRCPGPVHRNGWDLYSVGPNGIDEHGEGDDILVGENVAEVTSR